MNSLFIRRHVKKCVQSHNMMTKSIVSISNIMPINTRNNIQNNVTPSTSVIYRNMCSNDDKKMSFQETMKKMKQKTNLDDNESNVHAEASSQVVNEEREHNDEDKEEKEYSENDEEKKKEDGDESQSESESESLEKTGFSFSAFTENVTDFGQAIVDAVKERIKEQPEVEKTNLRRKIHQAVSFRRTSENLEDEEDADEDRYDGPSAMVHVAAPLTAWESMRSRLSSSPLISDIMKRSSKVRKAAQETTVGRTVERGANVVQDKIEVC